MKSTLEDNILIVVKTDNECRAEAITPSAYEFGNLNCKL